VTDDTILRLLSIVIAVFFISLVCELCYEFLEWHKLECLFVAEILLGWLNNSTEYDVLDFFSILE